MYYALLITVMLLSVLSGVVGVPVDFSYPGLPFTRKVRRWFAVLVYFLIGLFKDVLFMSKPWTSPLFMVLGVMFVNRVRSHWVVVAGVILVLLLLDGITHYILWGVSFPALRISLTAALSVLTSLFHVRMAERGEG